MNDQITPSEFLKANIYPDLDKALVALIEHVSKIDVIIRHQEHLIEQKTLDKIEQKKIEKEKLKKELGSEYESSDESGDDDFKRDLEDAIDNPAAKTEEMVSPGIIPELENVREEAMTSSLTSKEHSFPVKKNKFGMLVIEEGDEGEEMDLNPKKVELDDKQKFELELARVRREFNPVRYLGNYLKTMAQKGPRNPVNGGK